MMQKYLCEEFLFDSVHQLRAKVAGVQHDLMVEGDVVEHPRIYQPLSETNPIRHLDIHSVKVGWFLHITSIHTKF